MSNKSRSRSSSPKPRSPRSDIKETTQDLTPYNLLVTMIGECCNFTWLVKHNDCTSEEKQIILRWAKYMAIIPGNFFDAEYDNGLSDEEQKIHKNLYHRFTFGNENPNAFQIIHNECENRDTDNDHVFELPSPCKYVTIIDWY